MAQDQLNTSFPETWSIPALFDAYLQTIPPHDLLSYIITPVKERIPIRLSTIPWMLIPIILLIVMGYLARRPGTWLWRLALAPIAFIAMVRTAYGYEWTDPHFNAYNFGSGLAGLFGATKVLELAFLPDGILKVGEREPGLIENPAIELDRFEKETHPVNGTANGNGNGHNAVKPDIDVVHDKIHLRRGMGATPAEVAQESTSRRNPFVGGFLDSAEALASMRGIGWQFGSGTGLFIPPEWRDTTSRARFVQQTIISLLIHFTLFDVITSLIKLVPGIGTTDGGSIFAFGGDNVFRKYAISALIEFSTGVAFILGFEMVYQLVTLLSILVLRHDPRSWPPLFDAPWTAVSLHEFWAKRWHQLFRQTFLIMGGYPFAFLFSLASPPRVKKTSRMAGFVLGTFTASGLFHYWAMYAMGRGSDIQCLIFFVGQAFGIGLERVWRGVTGRRVGGWVGRVWVWLCVVGGIQWCINAWHERGFAGGMLVPPFISPTQNIFFPLARHVLHAVGISFNVKV